MSIPVFEITAAMRSEAARLNIPVEEYAFWLEIRRQRVAGIRTIERRLGLETIIVSKNEREERRRDAARTGRVEAQK